MTLVERRRTIYFRAENSNVAEQHAEQERYKGLRICSSRSDSAAHHEKSRCASSQHQLRSPALSVPDVPASQASSEVDVRVTIPGLDCAIMGSSGAMMTR